MAGEAREYTVANVGIITTPVPTVGREYTLTNVGMPTPVPAPAGEYTLLGDTTVEVPKLVKYWDGAAWVLAPIRYWNGRGWITGEPLKYWNGSTWITY
jgi:hypothetical protein